MRDIAAAVNQVVARSGGPVLWAAITPKRSQAAATLGAMMRERMQETGLVTMAGDYISREPDTSRRRSLISSVAISGLPAANCDVPVFFPWQRFFLLMPSELANH